MSKAVDLHHFFNMTIIGMLGISSLQGKSFVSTWRFDPEVSDLLLVAVDLSPTVFLDYSKVLFFNRLFLFL